MSNTDYLVYVSTTDGAFGFQMIPKQYGVTVFVVDKPKSGINFIERVSDNYHALLSFQHLPNECPYSKRTDLGKLMSDIYATIKHNSFIEEKAIYFQIAPFEGIDVLFSEPRLLHRLRETYITTDTVDFSKISLGKDPIVYAMGNNPVRKAKKLEPVY